MFVRLRDMQLVLVIILEMVQETVFLRMVQFAVGQLHLKLVEGNLYIGVQDHVECQLREVLNLQNLPKPTTTTPTAPTGKPKPISTSTTTTKTVKEGAGCKTNRDCGGLTCSNGQCVNRLANSEMKEASTNPTKTPSKVPGCLDGMTYCLSNKKCCPAGTCTAQGCMDPRTGRKIPGGSPIFESDEIIYEIEMDVEEIDETIYEIELDEVEGESEKKKGCCRPHYRCWSPYYQCVNCECVKAIKV